MKITSRNNFIRIFKIPAVFPRGFCFGGGKLVQFEMIDWFNPYPAIPIYTTEEAVGSDLSRAFLPLTDYPNGELELTQDLREKLNTMLTEFIRKKNYNDGSDLLAITDYGDAFIIKAETDEEIKTGN